MVLTLESILPRLLSLVPCAGNLDDNPATGSAELVVVGVRRSGLLEEVLDHLWA